MITGRPMILALVLGAALAALSPGRATASTGNAEALFRAGDYAAAADRFTAALSARTTPTAVKGLAAGRLHFDLGVCRLRLGQLAEAEDQMRRALILIDDAAGSGSGEGATAREGLATVLINQGNMIEAEEILNDALTTRKMLWGPGHPQTLRTLDLLASVHWLDGKPQQALALYEQVMSGLRAIHGNVHPLTATTAQNIGAVQMEINTDFTAELMFRQAIFITEALYGAGHPEMVAPLCGMGDIMTRAGLLDRAIDFYGRALTAIAARNSSAFDATQERVRVLTGLARVHIAQSQPAAALPLLTEAVARHDELRAVAGGDMEAATIGGSPRPLLAHVLLLLNRPEDAWLALEDGRGRLAVAWRESRGDSLQLRQLQIESALAAAPDPASKQRLQQRWNECHAARSATAAADIVTDAASARERVRRLLVPGDVLIGWLDVSLARGQRGAWIYVMAADQPVTWQRLPDAPWEETTRLLQRYREAVADVSPWDNQWLALSDSVWTLRLAAAESELAGASRLLVVTAAPMGGVPLAPLGAAGGPALIDRCEILAAPSALDFARAGASPTRLHLRPALVVADPPYSGQTTLLASRRSADADSFEVAIADTTSAMPDRTVLRSALGHNHNALGSLPRLTASRDEAASIRTAFPVGPTLLGAAASESELAAMASRGALKELGIIHLATHALVDCRAPDRSALVLADRDDATATGSDGLLTAREVRLGWNLDADLVTLSACETGLGRQTFDDGMLSLTSAFFAAGARNVVSSLWKVEDQATAKLMAYFYEELGRSDPNGKPVTVGGALRAAQLRLRDFTTVGGTQPYAGPWAWGGFVAYGGAGRR
jgi:CHAT domain-containing protein/Tfp pilus assembly protein PilF